MPGIHFGRENECIESVSKQGEVLSLLAKGDGIEIMTQKIKAGVVFWVEPGEDSSLLEFFYIVSGRVLWEDDGGCTELKHGEYFYVQNLKDCTHFKVLDDVTMLYVTSQPVFHYLSNEIENLMEMMKIVEKKDMYTHSHGVRLKDFSIRIGEMMKLSQKKLDMLYYSSLFHDIGKINISDEILMKPEKLMPEEYECVKKHPLDGKSIIEKTFLKEGVPGIVQHHERLDGSGYPYGLKGDEICIEGRIIAVADTYDAMTSDRPYRKSMDPKVAIDEIRSLVGRHYDKDVVDCLEAILKEDKII